MIWSASGVRVVSAHVSPSGWNSAFLPSTLAAAKVTKTVPIVEFVTQHQIPTMFQLGEGVRGGDLMEFGPKSDPMFRRAAAYIDKIANGADPATLPVEEPILFDLVINLKAAKQMGIEIPNSLLLQADRVIE